MLSSNKLTRIREMYDDTVFSFHSHVIPTDCIENATVYCSLHLIRTTKGSH